MASGSTLTRGIFLGVKTLNRLITTKPINVVKKWKQVSKVPNLNFSISKTHLLLSTIRTELTILSAMRPCIHKSFQVTLIDASSGGDCYRLYSLSGIDCSPDYIDYYFDYLDSVAFPTLSIDLVSDVSHSLAWIAFPTPLIIWHGLHSRLH